ncbi:hypothetical protein QWZ13_12250 [Reinekea marina]|uniref:DUF4348 domain-containing protein n=1 Tax=Reinekea marina TaxID=1310421 RepID=A0ABV7WU77_9GAMM|nr:hypothetical protein [Reinekea marina]MDN3649686.1 hypothetical protein [Reinekea marina]
MKKLIIMSIFMASPFTFSECVIELNREEIVHRFNSGELIYRFPFQHKVKSSELDYNEKIMDGDLSSIRESSAASLKLLQKDRANKWVATVNDDRAKLIYAAEVESNYRKWLFQKLDGCWYVSGFFEGTP